MMNSLKRNLAQEVHGPRRVHYKRSRVVVKAVFTDLWQMDLCDLSNYPDGPWKWILTVIDVGSKQAWARPLKTKSGQEVAGALKDIFDTAGITPRLIQADKGTEFYNKNVQTLLETYGVKLYSTFSDLKASVIERLNKTLKEMMHLEFSVQGNRKWVALLPTLMNRYNNRVHRSIGMAPAQVTKAMEPEILRRIRHSQPRGRARPKFRIGDRVRLAKLKRNIFEKSYLPNYTNEQFIITTVKSKDGVPYYRLKDVYGEPLEGRFYEQEMKKTAFPDHYLVEKIIRRKGDRVLVRWLGFSPEHDTWERIENVEGL